jgi:uncharacterized protein
MTSKLAIRRAEAVMALTEGGRSRRLPASTGSSSDLTFQRSAFAHTEGSACRTWDSLAIGIAAGVLSGLFGIGGGLLIVPTLVAVANFSTKTALGTSLASLLLPVGFLGAYAYYQHGEVDIQASLLIALGLFLGAGVGARFAQVMPVITLQRLFALFLVAMAVRLWIHAGG